MPTIDEKLRELINPDELDLFGPVPEERIAAAEAELGLSFPPSYRAFLRIFGAADTFGIGFDGLPDTRDSDLKMPRFLNVIDQTETFRHELRRDPPFPHHLIHVGSDGGGLSFFLDTSVKNEKGDSPVLAKAPGFPLQQVGSDFVHFLERMKFEKAPFVSLIPGSGYFL